MDSAHPVSPLDVVPLLLRQVSNQKIYTVLHLTGRLNLSHLRASMLLMAEQHPLLLHRLAIHDGTPEWVPHKSSFEPQCFSYRDIDADDTVICELICESRADRNSLLYVFVVHGKVRDSLCLSVDHTLADAAGAKAVAYELLANYARLATGSFAPPKRPLWRNSFRSLKNQFGLLGRINAAVNWRPVSGRWTMPPTLSSGLSSNMPSATKPADRSDGVPPAPALTYLLRHIGTAPVSALKRKLRPYGATINDLLLTALFRSLTHLHDVPPGTRLPVQFTVDLRRHLPAEQRFCVANLSGSAHIFLRRHAEKCFRQALADTQSKTTQIIQRNEALGGVLTLDLLFKLSINGTIGLLNRQFTASIRTHRANPLLTNFGVLDVDQVDLGTTGIDNAYMIGPALLTPGLLVSASSCRNRLTISAGFDAATTDANYIHAVIDLLSDHLTDLIIANSLN